MRIKESLIFPDVPTTKDEELKKYSDFLDELITLIGEFYRELSLLLNGEVNLTDNLRGDFVEYTTNATPDTEDEVSHNLKTIPTGYIVVKKNKACDIYTGTTDWASSKVYLKCSVASATVKIYLFVS